MKELAVVQAEKIKTEKPKFAFVHRKDGDADYASALISELASEVSRLIVFNCPSLTFTVFFCTHFRTSHYLLL